MATTSTTAETSFNSPRVLLEHRAVEVAPAQVIVFQFSQSLIGTGDHNLTPAVQPLPFNSPRVLLEHHFGLPHAELLLDFQFSQSLIGTLPQRWGICPCLPFNSPRVLLELIHALDLLHAANRFQFSQSLIGTPPLARTGRRSWSFQFSQSLIGTFLMLVFDMMRDLLSILPESYWNARKGADLHPAR